MPAKNVVKSYLENGYYHIYNRGVEKREIFLDAQDYNVFLKYLSEYLLYKDIDFLQTQLADPKIPWIEKDKILKLLRINNFYGEISMLAYCLMPNHLHFFLRQKSVDTIDRFMQSLCTRYTMYFNKKYKRVGSLFQAVYKGVLVDTEEQFLHLSRYIHKQAILQDQIVGLGNQPSSYEEYLGNRKTGWVYPENILVYFSQTQRSLTYQAFVEDGLLDLAPIQNVLLEDITI